METIIATGQITLVDLIDNATYIYYSPNEDGSGATLAPEANSKYIGIYSGISHNSNTLIWDFDTYNREIFNDYIVKIYDNVPTLSNLEKGFTITIKSPYEEEDLVLTQDNVNINATDDGSFFIISVDDTPIIIGSYSDYNNDGVFFEAGLYFIDLNYVVDVPSDLEDKAFSEIQFTINDYTGFTQPILPPEGTQWSSYVGNGIKKTIIEYTTYDNGVTPPESGWDTIIPEINQGEFLWTRTTIIYDDGNTEYSYSVSRNAIDGSDAEVYNPYSNRETIYRFYTTAGDKYSLDENSPLIFWLADSDNNIVPIKDNNGNDNYTITIDVLLPTIGEVEINTFLDNTNIFTNSPLKNDENNKWEFSLFNFLINKAPDESSDEDVINYISLINDFRQAQGILIKFYKENNFLANINIPIELGTSEDMAQFAITSNDIQAAIKHTKMEFSEDGLTIYNGALKIIEKVYEQEDIDSFEEGTDYYIMEGDNYILNTEPYDSNKVYYISSEDTLLEYEKEDKKLKIKGSGQFSGELVAARGTFEGELTAATGTFSGDLVAAGGTFSGNLSAPSGEIGGFNIETDSLTSTATFDKQDGETTKKIPYITLNGEDGSIIAQKIELGTEATIQDYIQLGESSYIYNPAENDNLFIKSGAIKIYNNGQADFGSIKVDGDYSKIYGTNFSITPDEASFSNVTVSGKIATSVFEIGKTQAVGGTMPFKPSAKVLNTEDKKIEIDIIDGLYFSVDDWVYVTQNSARTTTIIEGKVVEQSGNKKILKITEKQETETTCQLFLSEAPGFSVDNLIFLSNSINNLIIGINSNDTSQDMLYGQGISFIQAAETDGKLVTNNTKLFLGNLDKLNQNGVTGYGLYGTNVYLTGSLTTLVENSNTYAGVNTLDGVVSNKFGNNDEHIVFWAGSTGNTADNIKSSPFQVTDKGSLYAASGIFTGSIITDSEIYAAKLFTTKLYGWNKETTNIGNSSATAPLQIYDAANGIQFFKNSDEDSAYLTFDIGGFKTDNYFVSFNNDNTVDFNGKNATLTSSIKIGDDSQSIIINNNQIKSNKYILKLNDDYFSIGDINDNQFITTNSQNTNIQNDLYIQKDFYCASKMKYEYTNNGYDLYIY